VGEAGEEKKKIDLVQCLNNWLRKSKGRRNKHKKSLRVIISLKKNGEDKSGTRMLSFWKGGGKIGEK